MKWLAGRAPLLLPLALVVGPVVALVVMRLSTDDEIEAVRAVQAAVLTAAQARTIADERRVTGAPTWQEGHTLRGPDWRGTVTSVDLAPGGTLTSGQRVLSIDGVARLAIASPSPFFRKLKAGDSGTDVAELNAVLVALGHLTSITGNPALFSFDTYLAVQALEGALGVPGQPTGVFDPAWFIWLPVEPFGVGKIEVEPGEAAPPRGVAVAAESPRLTKLGLASANQQEPLALDPSVEWVLVIGTGRYPIDPENREVRPEALPDLQALLDPLAERIDGVVQRTTPLNVVGVASTAISVGAAGQLCAWLPESAGYRAQPVEVAGSRAGVTNVRSGLTAGQQLLANPAEVLESPVCP